MCKAIYLVILYSTEEVRSGQRSKAFVLATTSVQLNKIGGSRIYNTGLRALLVTVRKKVFTANL